jgi:hypothetical protein
MQDAWWYQMQQTLQTMAAIPVNLFAYSRIARASLCSYPIFQRSSMFK